MRWVFFACCLIFSSCSSKDYRSASRESAGIAPEPSKVDEAIFQVYTARAFDWRGILSVHSWIAWKEPESEQYSVTQAIGWRVRRGLPAVITKEDVPDRLWFDNQPSILYEARAEQAQKIIHRTKELIEAYPYKKDYRLWPGPNSNSYISYLIRRNEHVKIELPPHAIGKDWLANGSVLTSSPSKTGFQVSLLGVLGLTAGLGEGFEVNVLGLNFGIDLYTPALKLPLLGRFGWQDKAL